MKREMKKIIMFIGFMVYLTGLLLDGIVSEGLEIAVLLLSTPILTVLAVCFTYSENKTLINVGYSLIGVEGVVAILSLMGGSSSIANFGIIIMLVSSIFYLLGVLLAFFGFTKKSIDKGTQASDISSVLLEYKQLEKDKIISEEEFTELKNKTMSGIEKDEINLSDLKKWKKMLDQQVITQEEFGEIKSKIFRK